MKYCDSRFAFPLIIGVLVAFAPTTMAQRPTQRSSVQEAPQHVRVTARVNAPVAPDAIYVARRGVPGLSVIDLNGFGQGTGKPDFDLLNPTIQGNSTFPNNPNVSLQGTALTPPLAVGSSTLDGGSAGVFSLTKNTELEDNLLSDGSVMSTGDMMLGWPLDKAYNNGSPFGCQQGGGSLCSLSGLQQLTVVAAGANSVAPVGAGSTVVLNQVFGGGNPISFAPHPNPPAITTPPACAAPLIASGEPTSVDSLALGLVNLLVPGPLFLPDPTSMVPAVSLLAREQNTYFNGPSPPSSSLAGCRFFFIRQQLGHFLYMVDRAAQEVVVLNSNTMDVLDRISVVDPIELAMETNLSFLAVTSRSRGEVVFIGINPSSPSFHTVVKTTQVGAEPRGIAWDSGGEDLFVCNEGDDSVSIISGSTLEVRKTLRGLEAPIGVAVTPRQDSFGFRRDVYFAYILERSGRVALYESGPDGSAGWGYDDIIGYTSFVFPGARAIQPDHLRDSSGVWITHRQKLDSMGRPMLDGGAVSNLVLDASILGVQPLSGATPSMRGLSFRIEASIGRDQLTGFPRDLAFDNQVNLGVLPNPTTAFSAVAGIAMNGKSLVRDYGGALRHTNTPQFLFVPVQGGNGRGARVDVIALDSLERVDTDPWQAGVQSISVPGAFGVMDYFRQ